MKDEANPESGVDRSSDSANPGIAAGSSFLLPPSSFHRIRLGPPWGVVTEANRTRHARNFGSPRTLSPGDRVWLVCEFVPGVAEVTLNGVMVGKLQERGGFAADITAEVQARNKLMIVVASNELLGGVFLEIRSVSE